MDSFWDWFWLLVWTFFFVCFLMVLFQIIIDLFRDRDLSGWWKALWVIFLIIFPFLAALIYLIARGKGMAERSARKQVEYQEYSQEEMRKISFASPTEEIAKAQALRDQGVITDGEFEAIKAKALGSKY